MKLLKTLAILPFAAVVLAQEGSGNTSTSPAVDSTTVSLEDGANNTTDRPKNPQNNVDKLQAKPNRFCKKYFKEDQRNSNKMCKAFKACHFNEDMGRAGKNPISASEFAESCAGQCNNYLSREKVTALLFEDFETSLAALQAKQALDVEAEGKKKNMKALVSDKCRGLVFEPARTKKGKETKERVCEKKNKKDENGDRVGKVCVEIV